MSKLVALASGPGGLIGAGAVVVAAVVGGGAMLFTQSDGPAPVEAALVAVEPEAPPKVVPVEVPQTAAPKPAPAVVAVDPKPEAPAPEPTVVPPEPEASPTETAPVEAVQAPEATADPTPPRFDEIRTESDGLTVVAGQAAPGSTVILMVDGVEAMRVTAEANGAFVAVAFLDASTKARLLTLMQIDGQTQIASAEEIILAPSPQPEAVPEAVVVAAAPEPDAEPAPDPAPSPIDSAPADAQTPLPEAPTPQVAILKADAEGVEVINRSSAPEVMANVAIDTISYSDIGDVLLSGRAQVQAKAVRVYLNNAPVTTLDVDVSGRWRGDLPDVDTGIYTLRVDEVDAGGAVTSRVETPFKREASQVLAAANTASANETAPINAITVQTGATLWAIARERYGDGTLYVRVVAANADAIKDPDLIYPGQVFDLPKDP